VSADQPAVRVGPYVWLNRRGCQIVAAAMEYATRAATARNGGAGLGPDVLQVREVVRLAAEPPQPPADDAFGSASAPRPWRLDLSQLQPVLTVGQVAELRHVSPQAVRLALRTGRLAGTRLGRAWSVTEYDARSWTPGRPNGTAGKAQDTK
jgi:hypothetical protein